jgi:hypothetical protein
MLDKRLATSLAQIGGDPDSNDQSVARGLDWGKSVADQILAWRSTDGFSAGCRRTLPAAFPETGHRPRRPSVHRSSGSSRT